MQSFDFVVAVNTLVDAWEGVKPELIQTCFHTAGFMTYMPPPPEPLPEPRGTSGRECRIYSM